MQGYNFASHVQILESMFADGVVPTDGDILALTFFRFDPYAAAVQANFLRRRHALMLKHQKRE